MGKLSLGDSFRKRPAIWFFLLFFAAAILHKAVSLFLNKEELFFFTLSFLFFIGLVFSIIYRIVFPEKQKPDTIKKSQRDKIIN